MPFRPRSRDGVVLIILLALFAVAFLVTVFFAYQLNQKYQDEKKRAEKAGEENKILAAQYTEVETVVEDITKQVGYRRSEGSPIDPMFIAKDIAARKTYHMSFPMLEGDPKDVSALAINTIQATDPETQRTVEVGGTPLKLAVAKNVGKREDRSLLQKSAYTLQDVIADQDRLIKDLVQSNISLKQQMDKIVTELENSRNQFQAEKTDINTQFRTKLAQKDDAIRDAESKFSQVKGELDSKDTEIVAEIKRQRDEEVQDKQKKITDLQVKVRDLEKQIREERRNVRYLKATVQRISEVRDYPDGTVSFSDRENDLVYIDLGVQDGLQVGTTFTVFKPLSGGRRLIKGVVRVQRILGDHYSQCAVIDKEKDVEPVYPGDMIISPIFNRQRFRYFAFAGEFGGQHTRFSRAHAKALLEEQGGVVEDKVTVRTDVLIVGYEHQGKPNYEKAKELRVIIMTEDQFHRYIGYTK